jgi:hypothetical protein
VFAFEQKCQAKGQKLKLDNIKEWKIVSLLSLDKKKTQYALVHLITVEELLHIAKVPSLQIRRMCTMALESFKILYKLSPPCLNELAKGKNWN